MLGVFIGLGIAFIMLFIFCCCKVASWSDEIIENTYEKSGDYYDK